MVDNELKRSNSVKKLLSNPPNFTIRWGITFIFGLVITTIILCNYIPYNVLITTQGQIVKDSSKYIYTTHIGVDKIAYFKIGQIKELKITPISSNSQNSYIGTILTIRKDTIWNQHIVKVQLPMKKWKEYKINKDIEVEIVSEKNSLLGKIFKSVKPN